jgi:hypothetical protein
MVKTRDIIGGNNVTSYNLFMQTWQGPTDPCDKTRDWHD